MPIRIVLILALLPIGMGSTCNTDLAPFEPRPWSQAGADKESSGFNPVHSTQALPAAKKWTAPVGELFHSGPVIGPDGTIYVGNAAGELVAITPSGGERWRRKVDESILSSPAVNTETGDIFVIGQSHSELGLRSRIHHLNSSAGLLSSSTTEFVTLAAPKLWDHFIFVPATLPGEADANTLLVFDQANVLVPVGQVKVGCFSLVCGGGFDPLDLIAVIAQGIVDLSTCVLTFGIAGSCGTDFDPDPAPRTLPSVAVVDSPTLVREPTHPTIIIVTSQCASAFRFFPAGDGPPRGVPRIDPHFEPLWGHPLVPVDCDFDTVHSTSPAVIVGGQVVLGDENGRVLSLDAITGDELWHRDVLAPVTAPPVANFRHIYVMTTRFMVVIDSSDGTVVASPEIQFGDAAAVSTDFAYVATFHGIHTLDVFPSEGSVFDNSIADRPTHGISTPAVGPDGTLYVTTPTGFLHAYSN